MSQSIAASTGLTTLQGADAFVSELSPEAKRAVMSSLLRDAIRSAGENVPIPFDSPDGHVLGYYLPPSWSPPQRIVKPVLSPERESAVCTAAATPNDTFDPMELEEELSRTERD